MTKKVKNLGLRKFPLTDKQIKKDIFKYNPLRHSSVIFRKNLYQKYGGYDEALDGAEDYDLWLRYAGKTKLANCNIPLLKYRIHTERVSSLDEKKVLLSAINSRIKAIREYKYSYSNCIYVIMAAISYLMPRFFKEKIFSLTKRY